METPLDRVRSKVVLEQTEVCNVRGLLASPAHALHPLSLLTIPAWGQAHAFDQSSFILSSL